MADEIPVADSEDQDQTDQEGSFQPEPQESVDSDDMSALDVNLNLSKDKKDEVVSYLDENLPKMLISQKDEERIKAYFAMYDMATLQRNFPYENAPYSPSSDAYDKLNEWLDKAEVAFLITNGTFTIDREEVSLDEKDIRRMEKTWHKKYFWGSGFADELRLILFEAGFIGGSILSVREQFEVEPVREKVIIKTTEDLTNYQPTITKEDYNKAQEALSKRNVFVAERDVLKVIKAGSKIGRINRTNFLWPQNENDYKKWQIVAEREFYTKSDLMMMAESGELDMDEVETAISKNKERASYGFEDGDKKEMPEDLKPNALDLSNQSNTQGIKEWGDSYDQEFCVYRVTVKYKVETDADPNGVFRSWIETIYCPAGGNLLSSKFCKHGFPYFLVQYRPVPHRAIGTGIAQARFSFNCLDADMKSYFLATTEQEIGAPTLIKESSNLWASGFRAYPGSVAYTQNPRDDVMSFEMPEKSRLAVEGMKIILGSSPDANKGAGYASGKREELLQQQKNVTDQSRMHAIAIGLDAPVNMAWKIDCQVAKLNNKTRKWIDWVYDIEPPDTKLYMLESEMNPKIVWTSVLSAIAMSPDAIFQRAMQLKEIFHDSVPASVNDPKLSIAWLNFVANCVSEMDDKNRAELLPTVQTYMQYQQSLGQMGGQREQAPATQATAQSKNTPFQRPGQNGQKPQQPVGAFSPKLPTPSGQGFNAKAPLP